MADTMGILTAVLKIIKWLKEETEKNHLVWEMKQNGFAEISAKGYTFRLAAAEVEVPEERKIELPTEIGGGRAVALRRISQLFVLQGDNLIIHIASFMHPVLEREISSLADVVITQIAKRNEERLSRLLSDLGLTSSG